MTTAELKRTWTAYLKRRSLNDRNALVEHYVPWVRTVVKWLFSEASETLPIDQADLVSHGVIGLMRSIERFDPGKRTQFETFCFPRVKGAILDALRDLDWIPKRSRLALYRRGLARPCMMSLHHRSGRVRRVIDVHDDGPDANMEVCDTVFELTRGLNRTERLILILYYYEDLTMREIGQQVGLSEARVSQIHAELLRRLRQRFQTVDCLL